MHEKPNTASYGAQRNQFIHAITGVQPTLQPGIPANHLTAMISAVQDESYSDREAWVSALVAATIADTYERHIAQSEADPDDMLQSGVMAILEAAQSVDLQSASPPIEQMYESIDRIMTDHDDTEKLTIDDLEPGSVSFIPKVPRKRGPRIR